jgi:hypothetical protein
MAFSFPAVIETIARISKFVGLNMAQANACGLHSPPPVDSRERRRYIVGRAIPKPESLASLVRLSVDMDPVGGRQSFLPQIR